MQEEGSDLRLFTKTTNLSAEGPDNVTVLLTPNFDGKVWYEKDSKPQTYNFWKSDFRRKSDFPTVGGFISPHRPAL